MFASYGLVVFTPNCYELLFWAKLKDECRTLPALVWTVAL